MRRTSKLLVVVAVVGVLTAACGDDDAGDATDGASEKVTTTTSGQTADATTTMATSDVTGEITVFAAASLTESFTKIGEAFEAAHPGATVTFSFAASSALVQQINEGAPADVYASADESNMKKLTDAGNAHGEPEVFATNALQIITEAGNPKGIASVADLADPDLIVVTCSEEVPIGRYSAEVFSKAGVNVTPKSYEADVKAVVNKVTLGEADAGIVYATDVTAAGDKATGVAIPDDLNVIATYPIAVTNEASNVDAAEAFLEFVLSDEGQSILAEAGFRRP
jgi:molybdate transport system substrate-binding protein